MQEVQSICVFCGSSIHVDAVFQQAATATGKLIAEAGKTLVYGGGRVGLMGLCADAALAVGGKVIGVIPHHLQKWEKEHANLTELHEVDGMHPRKKMMYDRSDAFVILPGGLGTLDEAFEIILWKQLQLHDKPIVIVNIDGYWDPLVALIQRTVDRGFAHATHMNLFKVIRGVDEILPAIHSDHGPIVGPQFKWS